MIRKFSAGLLATAIFLGALMSLSSATASACSNDNRGYLTCADVNNDQDYNWNDHNRGMAWIQLPYAYGYGGGYVQVPDWAQNFAWFRVTDGADFSYLDLRDTRGHRPPPGDVFCEINYQFDYAHYRNGEFRINGGFGGWMN